MWIMRVGSLVSTPSSAASGRWCSTHFDILPNCRIKSRYASRPSPVLLFLSQFMTPFGQLAAEMTQCTDKPTHRYATWCAYIDKALIKLWEPPKFYSKQYFHTRLRRFGVRNFRLWKRAHTHISHADETGEERQPRLCAPNDLNGGFRAHRQSTTPRFMSSSNYYSLIFTTSHDIKWQLTLRLTSRLTSLADVSARNLWHHWMEFFTLRSLFTLLFHVSSCPTSTAHWKKFSDAENKFSFVLILTKNFS